MAVPVEQDPLVDLVRDNDEVMAYRHFGTLLYLVERRLVPRQLQKVCRRANADRGRQRLLELATFTCKQMPGLGEVGGSK